MATVHLVGPVSVMRNSTVLRSQRKRRVAIRSSRTRMAPSFARAASRAAASSFGALRSQERSLPNASITSSAFSDTVPLVLAASAFFMAITPPSR